MLLVLQDSLSLRGASRAAKTFFNQFPSWRGAFRSVSASTLSKWIQRIGLYNLTKHLQHGMWRVIIDLSVSIGDKKCLVIIGIPDLKFKQLVAEGKPMGFEHVTMLYMKVVEHSNQNVIYKALKAAEHRVGQITQCCVDGGSDLQAGVRLFQQEVLKQEGRKVLSFYDISHKIACFLKAEFEDDVVWCEFITKASKVKNKLHLTKAAYLSPPNQRSKSRYMNMEELSKWASKMLRCLEDKGHPDHELIKQHFSWLKPYEKKILDLEGCVLVAGIVRHELRTNGLSRASYEILNNKLLLSSLSFQACQLAGIILDFLKTVTDGLSEDNILLASSEIIESLFGKLKNLMDEETKKGFTNYVLSAAASLGTLDEETIKNALKSVNDDQVKEWGKNNVGTSNYGLRRNFFDRWLKKKKDGADEKQTSRKDSGQKPSGIPEEELGKTG